MISTWFVSPSYKRLLLILGTLVLLSGVALLFYAEHDEVALAIPVRFEHIPDDLIALRNTSPVLEARLKGPSRVLRGVKDSGLFYEVDLSLAKPGPFVVKISPAKIKVPWRVSVLEIDPSSFTITIDKRAEKVVPVVPDLNQDAAPGYIISRVVATPSFVQLTGPMTVLKEISALRTTPVDVGGLTETIKKRAALNLNHDPHVQAIGAELVELEIVVEQETVEKWLDMPVQASGGNFKSVITPDRVEILLRGPVNTLKKLPHENGGVQVYVDLSGLKPGTYVRPAVIKPPLDTTLVEAKPRVFTVKVIQSP